MEVRSATSGEILLVLLAEQVAEQLVKDVKDLLSPHLGVPRFRQRLFDANLAIMEDSTRFDIVPEKIQLVALAFNPCACVNASSPLYYAAQEGHPDVVRYLLAAGAEKKCGTLHGGTPLFQAVVESEHTVVDILRKLQRM
eukprot:s2851_g7.t1